MLNVFAEHATQSRMHEVGGGVVAHGGGSTRAIDLRIEQIADFDLTVFNANMVAEHIGQNFGGVVYDEFRAGVAEYARITDLPATLGVERRLIENHDALLP